MIMIMMMVMMMVVITVYNTLIVVMKRYCVGKNNEKSFQGFTIALIGRYCIEVNRNNP